MANVVSRDLFPWSVIIPQLERKRTEECSADFTAARNDFAATLLQMWQGMVYSTVRHMLDDKMIEFFTEQAGAMLSKMLGSEDARAMVLQALSSESGKEYINLHTPTTWRQGGQAWRYYMFLAGCCITTKDEALQAWGRVPPTALWRGRLQDDHGLFGHQWLRECMIETGRTGELCTPDDDSASWQEGVRRGYNFVLLEELL